MRLLLLGHGRMGRLVEALAPEYGAEIVGVIDEFSGPDALSPELIPRADVAIDFTTAAAVVANFPRLAEARINIVIGTTGWSEKESELRAIASTAGIGVLAAPNFSIGAVLFGEIAARAAELLAAREDFGAWIHEAHHAAKIDAPSGTALGLRQRMESAGYARRIDVSSTRAGHIPGIHTIGFDGPSETITLTHSVRDRGTFARGALLAARWLKGRRGWFTMPDCLGIGAKPESWTGSGGG
ncbi:MAG TPA: dihydrodipicolinate reductase C-terminal domain-containing protein [Vicinamibacterales bacterium]|nr:dihydrodipicolinate reductase C-terminal domain-containing protein [Vicinamibacterales bacterium]